MPSTQLQDQVATLTKATQFLNSSVERLIAQWKSDDAEGQIVDGVLLPTKDSYDAHKTILGAIGKIQELVSNPPIRLIETSHQFYESRALHIATEHRIADLVAENDEKGVAIAELAKKANVDEDMLCMFTKTVLIDALMANIMHLCSAHTASVDFDWYLS